jgi:nitrogen regulatory protein PII
VVAAVSQAANNGQIGAGKIFVWDVLEAVRVRTGERNAAAI